MDSITIQQLWNKEKLYIFSFEKREPAYIYYFCLKALKTSDEIVREQNIFWQS